MGKTLYDKLWDSHVIHVEADGTTLLYIDRQLLHEVSPEPKETLSSAAGNGIVALRHRARRHQQGGVRIS